MLLRRLYLYLVSAAALVVLAVGLASLGSTILLFIYNDPSADFARPQLAIFAAMTIVAFPVWGVHFWFGQRYATRDPYERASAIRHLYLYFACLVFSLAGMIFLAMSAGQFLRPVLDGATLNVKWATQDGWGAAVFIGIWAFHFWIASRDRVAIDEEGASATLRRWYMYVALLVGLLTMLSFTQQLFQVAWTSLSGPPGATPELAVPTGAILAGGLLWGFHARTIAVNHIADDRHSTLRAVEGFLAVTISIVTALFGASQVLYYALARVLGVDNPGGAGNDLLTAAAPPASMLLVYGVAWILTSRRLARDASAQEADRQAGARRLYVNLVSLLSLGVWASGAVVVIATLLVEIEAPVIGVTAPDWKNPISLGVTLLIVGLGVWLTYWRQSPWAADRQSLARRLYVWASLLGSVLAVLIAGVNLVNVVLQQAFSANPRLDSPDNLGFARALAVIVVAAGVGVYHWQVLRADAAARPARRSQAATPAPNVVVTASPSPEKDAAPVTEALGPHSRRYTLVVTDATEDDVHQALSSLPPQASYKLTATEQNVVRH